MKLSIADFVDRKVIWFGGLGALGCLLAALIGEPWLWLTGGQKKLPMSICLLLDSSGSMEGNKIEEMKQAASDFVQRCDLSLDQISIVAFDSVASIRSPLIQDKNRLLDALIRIGVGGSTNMADGISTSLSTFGNASSRKFILLFTDGMPDLADPTMQAASDASGQGVQIMAIATGDANENFLAQLTGDGKFVFAASDGQFGLAFQDAENSMHDLVGSGASGSSSSWGMIRVGVWTMLLASGIGLALIIAQNLYLHQPALSNREAIVGGISSAVIGFLAGGMSQRLMQIALEQGGVLMVLGRMTGWTLIGALLGYGLAWFIPNLKHLRGLAGGLVGGIVGVICFLILGAIFADAIGRLGGAAILGFCIGAMIALFEAALREAWLEIDYGNGELRKVSLGREPVSIGSEASQCTVFVRQAAPRAFEYLLKEGEAICRDLVHHRESIIRPGDEKSIERVTLRLRSGGTATSHSVSNLAWPSSRQKSQTKNVPSTDPDSKNKESRTLEILIQGRKSALTLGAKLRVRDLPGLESAESEKFVAEVVSNPQDPSVFGLKNLMNTAWKSKSPGGRRSEVAPNRTVRIESGTRIEFTKNLEGVVL